MSGVYSVEDLLKLRASPLICKPANLPPIEEWMGSQEPTIKRPTTRGRQDDSNLHTEGFQKRPALDPSLRKSTTDPERIVLGPPRRSFASSNARTLGRAPSNEADEPQKEGVGRHERTKTGDDLENKLGDRRSGQLGGINGRFGIRHDQDHERPRRRFDDEEMDLKLRKDHDRPRWSREEKAGDELDENDNAKPGYKRDSQTRSRFEQSWLRSDRGTEDARRDTERSGWRRDRARDGDWDTPVKGDMDPEWMDAPDHTEPVQAHTQEDFQRWKERMRAAANGPAETKQGPPATIVASIPDDTKVGAGAPTAGLRPSELNDNSMDKFFAKFTEKRTATEDKPVTAKPAAKSKFASLFSPPPVEPKPELPQLPAFQPSPVTAPAVKAKSPLPFGEAPNSTDADQAGFKRILEMLGKRGGTPTEVSKPLHSNTTSREQQSQEKYQSSDLMSLFIKSEAPRQTAMAPPPPGLERLIESRSPASGHRRQETPNKDELLLNLLRQADISAKPSQQSQREYSDQRPPADLFAGMTEPSRNDPRQLYDDRPDGDRQRPMQQREPSRSLFEDPAVSSFPYPAETGPRQGMQRKPTNGFDDPYLERLRLQEQKQMQPPPGMSRPPGLDQISHMPPGWPGQPPPPPHQQQQRQGPPPVINMARNIQPPFPAQQQGPMPQMQQPGQRAPQRKYTGDSSLLNFPPGFGPPPGLMGNGPPPPPGFHQGNGGNQPQGYARYMMGGDGQGPQPQGHPGIGRGGFMDMYGNVERGGLRGNNGGVQLPPGFR